MSSKPQAECCPPQTASSPVKPGHPHPVSEKTGQPLDGKFEKLGGFDEVYITGPADAKHAIVSLYDIFGMWETTLRGQDLLVNNLSTAAPTRIFMPDVFRGKAITKEQDGNKEVLGEFFKTVAKISDRLPEIIEFAEHVKRLGYETVSILGYCWGGKVVLEALSSDKIPSPFCCGAIVHPAMLSAEDGAKLALPLGFYPSIDEPKDTVEKIQDAIKEKPFAGKCDIKIYSDVHHGWAAARADLENEINLREYNDVYARLAKFYSSTCC